MSTNPSEALYLPAPAAGTLRMMFLGDVFGEPGRKAVQERIPQLQERCQVDFTVVNGENAAAGRGITGKLCIGLLRAGAAVITLGDHAFDQPDILTYMPTEPRLLRPLNYPAGTPGHGSVVLETEKGKVAVLCAQGRVFMNQGLENAFPLVRQEAERLRKETPVILCDFHAEATSEKIAMARYLDGLVSAVIGTHTHVQTADETIFPGGTAFLCDAGMCGPEESVIGSTIEPVITRFTTFMPSRLAVATGPVLVCGAIVDVDMATGKAVSIVRVRERMGDAAAPAAS